MALWIRVDELFRRLARGRPPRDRAEDAGFLWRLAGHARIAGSGTDAPAGASSLCERDLTERPPQAMVFAAAVVKSSCSIET